MAGLTDPYRQHHYMGEFTNVAGTDTPVLTEIRARKWDSAGNGTGNPIAGMMYYDSTNNLMKYYNGSAWTMAAGVTDHGALTGLSDDDHSQYSLVTGARAFSGTVGGVTPTDAAHLATKGYVDGLVQGAEWQDSVINRTLSVPPGSPAVGDRYIVASAANYAITAVNTGAKTFTVAEDISALVLATHHIRIVGSTGNDRDYTVVSSTYDTDHTDVVVSEVVADGTADGNLHRAGTGWQVVGPYNVTQYATGSTWTRFIALEGWAAWVDNENVAYVFNGSTWVKMSSVFAHNDLAGLDGGTSGQYYHLTSSDYTTLRGGSSDASSLHNHTSEYPEISSYAGNPNGNVAGKIGDIVKDTSNGIMYTCFTTGNAAAAVWVVM